MVDLAKLCSPVRSAFEVLVVWHVFECCCGEGARSFELAAGVAVFSASH